MYSGCLNHEGIAAASTLRHSEFRTSDWVSIAGVNQSTNWTVCVDKLTSRWPEDILRIWKTDIFDQPCFHGYQLCIYFSETQSCFLVLRCVAGVSEIWIHHVLTCLMAHQHFDLIITVVFVLHLPQAPRCPDRGHRFRMAPHKKSWTCREGRNLDSTGLHRHRKRVELSTYGHMVFGCLFSTRRTKPSSWTAPTAAYVVVICHVWFTTA